MVQPFLHHCCDVDGVKKILLTQYVVCMRCTNSERHMSNCDGQQMILMQKGNTSNNNGRQESARENIPKRYSQTSLKTSVFKTILERSKYDKFHRKQMTFN